MTRHTFAQSPADWTYTVGDGNAAVLTGGITLTLWDLPTSGTQQTDLLDSTGEPTTTVTSSTGSDGLPIGTIPVFWGPDGATLLWADAGGGTRSVLMATDLGPDIATALATAQNAATSAAAKLDKAAGGTVTGPTTFTGAVTGIPGGLDARWFGAKGDGTTDDTTAIQAALDAAGAQPGGTVYLATGVYRTSAPVTIPPFVTLMSSHGGAEAQGGAPAPVCSIKPLASFAGNAVVEILDQDLGDYATLSSEQAVQDLTIDGSALVATVDGIRATGQVQGLRLQDVQIRSVTGQGITTAYNLAVVSGPQAPFCVHLERVSVLWCGESGIALNNTTDSAFVDVYVLGCAGYGWYISGAGNSTLVACRAEWSGLEGFNLAAGDGGTLRLIGCSTDRNAQNGILVNGATDTGAVLIAGADLRRDGSSGGYSALAVSSTTRPVIVDGLVVTTAGDDDGGGTVSPQYGVSATGAAYVAVNSGRITATTAAWHDGGSNTVLLRGPLVTGTGITSWTWPGTATTTAATSTTRILQALVAGDTQPRIAIDGSGKLQWGPGGSGALDVDLYRNAGQLQTDSYFVLGGGGQSNGSFTSWNNTAKALIAGAVGGGLAVAEGTNGRMGTATLVAGTVTVANTSVTASSRIFLTAQTSGGSPGALRVSARTAGTSFTITSTSSSDTSVVAWMLAEPA